MDGLQKTVLSMIKTELWGEPFCPEEGVSDKDMFGEASRYGLVGFLSDKLDDFCRDDAETRKKWSKRALADYYKSLRVLDAQASLCDILREHEIKPVIMKGMASAWYYPDPMLRQIGDIDFIVPPGKFDECCRVLEENGYERGEDVERHLEYEKQGLEYECHRYFSMNESDKDRTVDEILYAGCAKCVTRDVAGKKYYAHPDDYYGLVLLQHTKHHLFGGMGFRQFIDWVVYADKVLDDAMWEKTFSGRIRECGFEMLAKVMTKTAQNYLGLKKDGITWCDDADDEICERLIQYIFACDNFGVSSEDDEAVHRMGTIFRAGFFRSFDKAALDHVPVARKHAVLRPIAWGYQILRWAINGPRKLMKRDEGSVSVEELKRQKKLMKDLGV